MCLLLVFVCIYTCLYVHLYTHPLIYIYILYVENYGVILMHLISIKNTTFVNSSFSFLFFDSEKPSFHYLFICSLISSVCQYVSTLSWSLLSLPHPTSLQMPSSLHPGSDWHLTPPEFWHLPNSPFCMDAYFTLLSSDTCASHSEVFFIHFGLSYLHSYPFPWTYCLSFETIC